MKRLCVRTSLVLALLILFTQFNPSKANAEEVQLWFSGITSTDVSVGKTSHDGNTRCEYGTASSQFLQNVTLIGNIFGITDSTKLVTGNVYTSQCLYSTSEGLFGTNNLWSPDGNPNTVMPIDNSSYPVRSLGRSGFIAREGSPSGGLSVSYTAKSFKDTGSVTAKTYGSGISRKVERAWSIDTSKLSEFYTYSDRSLVRFNEFATSRNGEYAVGAVATRGLVRIHLPTGKLTVVSNSTFNNGVGLFMSISNDGRYVVSSKAGSGRLMVYDLLNCSQSYDTGQWPRYDVFTGSGCAGKDLYPELRTIYPTITNISGLHFTDKSSELELFIFKPNAQGQSQSQLVRLSSAGFISSARGYLALGDSFASGEGDLNGAVWYESGTDEQGDKQTFDLRNLCHLSRRSYPYLMALQVGYIVTNTSSVSETSLFRSVACSGAKTHNLVGSSYGEKQTDGNAADFANTNNQYRYYRSFLKEWLPGYEKQTGYLNGRSDTLVLRNGINPEIITLSIGGNDAGFGKKLLACAGFGSCEIASDPVRRAQVAVELGLLKPKLEAAYKTIRSEAPDARIYVIGYPQFIQKEGGYCRLNTPFDDQERVFIHEAVSYMNDVIESAARGAGVTYVDVEDILTGSNLCSEPSDGMHSVNGVTAGNDVDLAGFCSWRDGCIGSESFHPNHFGHQKYAERIMTVTQNLTENNPQPSQELIPRPQDYFGSFAWEEIQQFNNNDFSTPNPLTVDLITGMAGPGSVVIKFNGLYPGSNVWFEIHSDPISLGGATVGSDGSVSFTADLPADLPPGYHEIHAYGFDEFGNPVNFYEPILVGAQEDDFDGDGIIDELDSCPVVTNSGLDVDEDGIDDACDLEAILPIQEEEQPPENPVDETPVDETPVEEQPIDEEGPAEYVEDKGAPNPETVAGDEQIVEQGSVLGVSTGTVIGATAVLAATGISIGVFTAIGFSIVFLAVFLRQQEKH